MLIIKNIGKIRGNEVKDTNGINYVISDVFITDNFYTFSMYSNTHAGFSQTIRLSRHSNKSFQIFDDVPVYDFIDCTSVRVTADYIKNMKNLISSLHSVINITNQNPK